MSEVDQTLRRIEGNKSVIGTLVLDGENHVIHSAFKGIDPSSKSPVQLFSDRLPPLIERTRCMVRDLDPTNDLTFLRIRAEKTEILVAPGDDYTLIVIQNVNLIEN